MTSVAPRGPAYQNLFTDDLILAQLYPTQREIRSLDDLQNAVASLKDGDVIELKVCHPDPSTSTCRTRAVSLAVEK